MKPKPKRFRHSLPTHYAESTARCLRSWLPTSALALRAAHKRSHSPLSSPSVRALVLPVRESDGTTASKLHNSNIYHHPLFFRGPRGTNTQFDHVHTSARNAVNHTNSIEGTDNVETERTQILNFYSKLQHTRRT